MGRGRLPRAGFCKVLRVRGCVVPGAGRGLCTGTENKGYVYGFSVWGQTYMGAESRGIAQSCQEWGCCMVLKTRGGGGGAGEGCCSSFTPARNS